MFESMGTEIGNLYLGSIGTGKLHRELNARGSDATWFRSAAKGWTQRVKDDFAEFWRKPK